MQPFLAGAYEAAARTARLLASLAPADGRSKLLRSLAGRRHLLDRFAHWGRDARDPSLPLLWMHAPSVGEGLQARPVLQRLRATSPRLQLAYTYFSSSAESFARGLDVDFRDYLPFDATADVRDALAALRPTALVFSKVDVWPRLALEASVRGVRLGLVSATLPARSSRRSRLAGALLRDAYTRLDLIGAIDEGDAERLVALGARTSAIEVTGDTRYDQVWERARSVDRSRPPLSRIADERRPTLVAGSTWPADEARLLPAWAALVRRRPTMRLLIAPHEPTRAHLEPIERWAADLSLRVARLDAPDAAIADVVVVDRVGVLGDLYALADVAYVGGGFHRAGLHSVLEPAAFGAPVLFGPRHENSRDATLLRAAGGALTVRDARALEMLLEEWLSDPASSAAAGASARAVVVAGLGAADRSVDLVRRLLN